MKSSLRSLPLVVLTALLLAHVSSLPAQTIAGAPNTIDYQGKALDAQGAVLAPSTAANYEMTFRIYDAQEGGTIIWAEKQIVTVFKGLFSVRLGEGTTIGEGTVLQTNLADAFNAASRFLGVTILITGQSPVEILPRLAFLATPFAYSANRSVTAERLVLNPSASAVPSAVNASALSFATQTLNNGDHTLNENNHTVVGNAASGAVNITLPAVTTRREYSIVKTDTSLNLVQVMPPSRLRSRTSPEMIGGSSAIRATRPPWVRLSRSVNFGMARGRRAIICATATPTAAPTSSRPSCSP